MTVQHGSSLEIWEKSTIVVFRAVIELELRFVVKVGEFGHFGLEIGIGGRVIGFKGASVSEWQWVGFILVLILLKDFWAGILKVALFATIHAKFVLSAVSAFMFGKLLKARFRSGKVDGWVIRRFCLSRVGIRLACVSGIPHLVVFIKSLGMANKVNHGSWSR